jgi:ATP-dependent DNA helicase DinG
MPQTMTDVADLLGPHGPFAASVPGFRPREAQRRMARAVADAIADRRMLLCEAGTGIGKTFAYLVPALLSGRRVIVSTGTRHLQDQVQQHDLPAVRAALGAPASVAVLKGRANYLCLHRYEALDREWRMPSRAAALELAAVKRWLPATASGDLAEVESLGEDSPLLPRLTSTSENCLGTKCERYQDCFVVKARRRAQESDIVVINHHLLLADLVLKEHGFGELLPSADAVIVDEAHQLPDLAAQFFGASFASRQVLALADDALAALGPDATEAAVAKRVGALEPAVRELRLALGVEARRAAWDQVAARPELHEALAALQAALREVAALFAARAADGREHEALQARADDLAGQLQPFLGGALAGDDEPEPMVLWFETFTRSFVLNATPLDAAERFRRHLAARPQAWIFTSATLAVGADFGHFARRLGVGAASGREGDDPDAAPRDDGIPEEVERLALASPYDYQRNALLYLPRGLPEPDAAGYTEAVVRAALPLLEASRGRAFMLFTSHRALQAAAAALRGRLEHPLLTQGEMPRARLIERFRAAGDAVLLGTASFWEGVDVKGPALSLVIIDKLPFASPGDPVMAARIAAARERGGNPFGELQLPQAVLALKQGVGRLIRDADDTGVMMLCDPRLQSRSYGRTFIRALPPMRATEAAADAIEFLREHTKLGAAVA